MNNFAFTFLVCVNMFIFNKYARALSLDELKQKYVKLIMECSKEYSITATDLELLKKKQMPDNDAPKCLFACAYKKAGMMDDQGKLSIEGVNQIIEQNLADDAIILERARAYTEACKSVNDEEVNDGERGCDRAAMIFKCSVEKASQFDFIM